VQACRFYKIILFNFTKAYASLSTESPPLCLPLGTRQKGGDQLGMRKLCTALLQKIGANRHDRNLHEGKGIIISILDYVVGRISGQFQSNDPLKSRRNKQDNLLFGSKTINNNVGTKVITDSTSGGVSEVSDNNTIQERASHNPDLLSQPKSEAKVNNRARPLILLRRLYKENRSLNNTADY